MRFLLFIFSLFLLLTLPVFAQTIPDNIDLGKVLLDLISNWKSLGPVGIGMSFVLIAVALVKNPILTSTFPKFFKSLAVRFAVIVLGQVYAILYLVQSGSSWGQAAIIGLVASNGAQLLYENLKPIIEALKGKK